MTGKDFWDFFGDKNVFFCAFSKSCEQHKCQKDRCEAFDIAVQGGIIGGDVPFGVPGAVCILATT